MPIMNYATILCILETFVRKPGSENSSSIFKENILRGRSFFKWVAPLEPLPFRRVGWERVGGWPRPKKYLWDLILENLKHSVCSKTKYFAMNFYRILISMAIKWTIEFKPNYSCFHAGQCMAAPYKLDTTRQSQIFDHQLLTTEAKSYILGHRSPWQKVDFW